MASPGQYYRKGLSLIQLADKFPTDDAAREWFESECWPEGPECPHCGTRNVQSGIRHKTMTHRCRECEGRPMFMSVINERSHAHLQRQVDRMRQAWAANPTSRPQAMDIGIPVNCLNKEQSTKLTGHSFLARPSVVSGVSAYLWGRR